LDNLQRISSAAAWLRETLKPRDLFMLVPAVIYFGFMIVTQLSAGAFLPALMSAAWVSLLVAFLLWMAHRRARSRA